MSKDQEPKLRREAPFELFPETQRNRDHLRQVISHYLSGLTTSLPVDQNGTLQILSVGCGIGYEVSPLVEIFPHAQYRGVDINLSPATELYNRDVVSPKVNFVKEDILKGKPEKEYGLVFVRHPEVMGDLFVAVAMIMGAHMSNSLEDISERVSPLWRLIFAASCQKVTNGGYIFVTTTNLRENQATEFCLRENGVDVLLEEQQAISKLDASFGFGDQYVVLGKKQ